jgi:hypothetical protein
MKDQCLKCEYLPYCFWCLKFIQMYLSPEPCKQGRKRKEFRQKQTTLPAGDTEVELSTV